MTSAPQMQLAYHASASVTLESWSGKMCVDNNLAATVTRGHVPLRH